MSRPTLGALPPTGLYRHKLVRCAALGIHRAEPAKHLLDRTGWATELDGEPLYSAPPRCSHGHGDLLGLDVFGIGEHHRREFLDSAPPVILAAAAARTKHIRLTSAVAVLSAADPGRLFQQFATLDLISQGRAEMVVGRDLDDQVYEDSSRRELWRRMCVDLFDESRLRDREP